MMDLEGMLEKIPSTEKILGVAWILSWVLAIWIYHIQFFLTGLFCLFLVLILMGKSDTHEEKDRTHKPPAVFSMDKNTNTLRVLKLYEKGLKWDEHEVCSGDASLPSGVIREGDVVEGCKGNVAIRHVPSNRLFGGFDFEE